MKKVIFGQRGGFPLEQETFINLQKAYADDTLEALLGQWGIDPNERYILKVPSNDEDGFMLTKVSRDITVNDVTETVNKVELIRLRCSQGLNYNSSYINIKDRYSYFDLNTSDPNDEIIFEADGTRVFGQGGNYKIYEDFVGILSTDPLSDTILSFHGSELIILPSTLELQNQIQNITLQNIGRFSAENIYKAETDSTGLREIPFKIRKVDGRDGLQDAIENESAVIQIDLDWLDNYLDAYFGDLNLPPSITVFESTSGTSTGNQSININTLENTSKYIQELKAIALDPDGDALEYTWSFVSGHTAEDLLVPNSTLCNVQINRSQVGSRTIKVKCTVDDGNGGVASDEIEIGITVEEIPQTGTEWGIVLGDCDDNPASLSFQPVYMDSSITGGPGLEDVVYTDSALTIPFNGNNSVYRIGVPSTLGAGHLVLPKEYEITNLGEITLVTDCSGTSGGSDATITTPVIHSSCDSGMVVTVTVPVGETRQISVTKSGQANYIGGNQSGITADVIVGANIVNQTINTTTTYGLILDAEGPGNELGTSTITLSVTGGNSIQLLRVHQSNPAFC